MAKGTKGKLVQVIGTVVDVEFPAEELPSVYNAVEVDARDGKKLIVEVQQHLGNNWMRCLAMDTTDGLRRGAECVDTGAPIAGPVGHACLGRLVNGLGGAPGGSFICPETITVLSMAPDSRISCQRSFPSRERSPTPAKTEKPPCSVAMLRMSSWMMTVLPTPAPP